MASLDKWLVTDYEWTNLSCDNLLDLQNMGATTKRMDALDIPTYLTPPERRDVRLAIMSCPCLIAAHRDFFLAQQNKFSYESNVMLGIWQKAKFAAVLFDTVCSHLPNAVVILVVRKGDTVALQSKERSVFIVPMQNIPGWKPKMCNTDTIQMLQGSGSLVAWIAMPRQCGPLGGSDALKDVIGAMALEGSLDLRRACLHATLRESSVLFLGEWDASLSRECGRWTLMELMDLDRTASMKYRRITIDIVEEAELKREWRGREWTWQEVRKYAEQEFAKAVSKCENLQKADDKVKTETWKVGMKASYMWYVSPTLT